MDRIKRYCISVWNLPFNLDESSAVFFFQIKYTNSNAECNRFFIVGPTLVFSCLPGVSMVFWLTVQPPLPQYFSIIFSRKGMISLLYLFPSAWKQKRKKCIAVTTSVCPLRWLSHLENALPWRLKKRLTSLVSQFGDVGIWKCLSGPHVYGMVMLFWQLQKVVRHLRFGALQKKERPL